MSALGMTTTVLATGLADAIQKDIHHQLASLRVEPFGVHVSAWLKEVAVAFTTGQPIVCRSGPDPLIAIKERLEALMLACREGRVEPEYKDFVELYMLLGGS